jgi:hypothetical protein
MLPGGEEDLRKAIVLAFPPIAFDGLVTPIDGNEWVEKLVSLDDEFDLALNLRMPVSLTCYCLHNHSIRPLACFDCFPSDLSQGGDVASIAAPLVLLAGVFLGSRPRAVSAGPPSIGNYISVDPPFELTIPRGYGVHTGKGEHGGYIPISHGDSLVCITYPLGRYREPLSMVPRWKSRCCRRRLSRLA